MSPKDQDYIQTLIGDILSDKLKNSRYKDAPREQQLSYLLGVATAIITQSVKDDDITLSRLRRRLPK